MNDKQQALKDSLQDEEVRQSAALSPYGTAILRALQRPDRWASLYGGTVGSVEKQRRRARARRARASRKANRR